MRIALAVAAKSALGVADRPHSGLVGAAADRAFDALPLTRGPHRVAPELDQPVLPRGRAMWSNEPAHPGRRAAVRARAGRLRGR
ncbi:MAG: hypothetical protein DLM56_14685 [Pseudonocardiales bacterium]|nr:MAG: hypothetical protein DLM56_14685 [Pseudonocardiales bacterium]